MNTTAAAGKTASLLARYDLVYRRGCGRAALDCWMALPHDPNPETTPLVAVHGIRRQARQQAASYAARAAALGRVVIAPIFSATAWPRYQQVVRRGRADVALLDLMCALHAAGTWRGDAFELAGFSGGAQFAHRFAMLYPDLVSRLTVAAAGWYTFPDQALYPYGLSPRPGCADAWGTGPASQLERFLRLPIETCIGARDCVADGNTRRGAKIDRQQGTHRLARAQRWVGSLRAAAARRGIRPRVALHVLPGCGHSFRDCVAFGGLDRLVLPGTQLQTAPRSARAA